MMRICIPTENDQGLEAPVYGHFGSAPYFTIVDVDDDSIEIIDNGNNHHVHGQCQPLGQLQGKSVDCLVVGGIGRRALQILNSQGLKVLQARPGTVADTCEAYRKGEIYELSEEHACGGHDHGPGGCGH
jgi:predicted Fe-Mo cluster-binding NifX family protein